MSLLFTKFRLKEMLLILGKKFGELLFDLVPTSFSFFAPHIFGQRTFTESRRLGNVLLVCMLVPDECLYRFYQRRFRLMANIVLSCLHGRWSSVGTLR